MGEKRVKAHIPVEGGSCWFHTNFPISDFSQAVEWKYPVDLKSFMGAAGDNLAVAVLAIPGIERVLVSPYCLSVYPSKAVLHEEMEPAVFAAFKSVFPELNLHCYGVDEEIDPVSETSFWNKVKNLLRAPFRGWGFGDF